MSVDAARAVAAEAGRRGKLHGWLHRALHRPCLPVAGRSHANDPALARRNRRRNERRDLRIHRLAWVTEGSDPCMTLPRQVARLANDLARMVPFGNNDL